MSLQLDSVFTLIVVVLISIILLECNWTQGPVSAQSSYTPDTSTDSKNIIMKYCKQYADSAAMGIDVIQDLIGAGLVPNSYYGTTCHEEVNNK